MEKEKERAKVKRYFYYIFLSGILNLNMLN